MKKFLVLMLCSLVLIGCRPSPPGKICTKHRVTKVWVPERTYTTWVSTGKVMIPVFHHEEAHWEIKSKDCIEWKIDPKYKRK